MYEIKFTSGATPQTFQTYEECVNYIRREIGDADDPDGPAIGHSGDLEEGGDRTLFWFSESEAKNDDGSHALGCIRKVG